MTVLATFYGLVMIGYATLLMLLTWRSSPGDGMVTWVLSHAALLAASGLLMLAGAFAAPGARVFPVSAGLTLLLGVTLLRIKKRRVRRSDELESG